jgi:hypothetical protein
MTQIHPVRPPAHFHAAAVSQTLCPFGPTASQDRVQFGAHPPMPIPKPLKPPGVLRTFGRMLGDALYGSPFDMRPCYPPDHDIPRDQVYYSHEILESAIRQAVEQFGKNTTPRKIKGMTFSQEDIQKWLPERQDMALSDALSYLFHHDFLAPANDYRDYRLTNKGLRTMGFNSKTLKTDFAHLTLQGLPPVENCLLDIMKRVADQQKQDPAIQTKVAQATTAGTLSPSATLPEIYFNFDGFLRDVPKEPGFGGVTYKALDYALSNLAKLGYIKPIEYTKAEGNTHPGSSTYYLLCALGDRYYPSPFPSYFREESWRIPPQELIKGWTITEKGVATLAPERTKAP